MKSKLLLALLLTAIMGCSPPLEPEVTPGSTRIVPVSWPPNPIDHGLFPDVDPSRNAIWVEWRADSLNTTSGYEIYRSTTDRTSSDGLLEDRITLATLEPANALFESLDTLYRDTLNILLDTTYFYQVRPFHRSSSNRQSFGAPTEVSDLASFKLSGKLSLNLPRDETRIDGSPLLLNWTDSRDGGIYQIIVQEVLSGKFVWSSVGLDKFGTPMVEQYNGDGTGEALRTNLRYRWRVKKVGLYEGASSQWQEFTLVN